METLLQHETRESLSQKAKSGYAVIVPLGSTEQHGPHLPVYTDSMICGHVTSNAVRRAAEHVRVLVAPMLSVGCSDHHLDFGGTISLSSATYLNVLLDVGSSLVAAGFRKIIFLNGHGGNAPLMLQAASDLANKHPIWTAAASYWALAQADIKREHPDIAPLMPGHAGLYESSVIMALHPECVDMSGVPSRHPERYWAGRQPAGAFLGRHGELPGYDGYSDNPLTSTAEQGAACLDVIVESVKSWLVETIQTMEREEANRMKITG